MAAGSWTLADELFARGNPAFVGELRRVHAPEQLGAFAARWLVDRRPFAREALLDYLSRPLNAYRHEPLVKRLFKLAEAAGDDELMGAFLVAFDRTVRRARRTINRCKYEGFASQAEAEAAVRRWEAEGFRAVGVYGSSGRHWAHATRPEERVVTPGNTVMPRPPEKQRKRAEQVNDWMRDRLERKFLLFSLPTRRYLRRRAWRYFRKLGKADPKRYVAAAAGFLAKYRDADVESDIHLLDNWGLVHVLFHNCPALERPAKGWQFAEGKGLADLAFAPRLPDAWTAAPDRAFDLLLAARCRTVRLFAVWLLRTRHAEWLRQQPVGTLLKLADHPDPDVSAFGFDLLETAPDLSVLPVTEWLRRLDGDDLDKLTRLSALLQRRLDPDRVPTADAIRLAAHRSRPVAGLGLFLLRAKRFTEAVAVTLLPLVQAECEAVRPELVRWLQDVLSEFGPVRPEWLIEFLDSKHADVREFGWRWLTRSTVWDEPTLWPKLMESPYDDVRGSVADHLSAVIESTDADTLRLLWATMLLNIHRGGRRKPGVVRQIVERVGKRPGEAEQWLPLLAVAVRSLRGSEFRAGLSGVVTLGESHPELRPLIGRQFPELAM
ncbi:MAG: hypothetical protein U0871_25085 [Gemmataceae bacterium]